MESDKERIIRYADTIVINSNFKGELDKDCLDIFVAFTERELVPPLAAIRNELGNRQPNNVDENGTLQLDITKNYLQTNFDLVKKHLLDYGYIIEPDHTQEWVLSDIGKEMKKLKGHEKYQASKQRELAAIIGDQNSKRFYIPILVASIGVLISAGISLATYFYNKSKDKNATDNISKLDSFQQNTALKLQHLQSQVDSIFNHSLSKANTTNATPKASQ
jgi:hypothetical protein